MWILRTALVVLLFSAASSLICGGTKCAEGEKACGLVVEEGSSKCDVICSELNLPNCKEGPSGTMTCYCEGDNCDADEETNGNWNAYMYVDTTVSKYDVQLAKCIKKRKRLNKFTCGGLCENEDNSYKSCKILVQKSRQTCHVRCSTQDGSKNECSFYPNGKIECLCEENDCFKNRELITNWQKTVEDQDPSLMEFFDRCLHNNGKIEFSKKFLVCAGKRCHEGRASSCQFHIKEDGKCSGRCSYKDLKDDCEILDSDGIRCYCKGNNCHKQSNTMTAWKTAAEALRTGFSGLDECLYKTGAISRKSCGTEKCFHPVDKTCGLYIHAYNPKECKHFCSNEAIMGDCKEQFSRCWCKDDNCYKQETTVNEWRNKLSSEPRKRLEECLLLNQVLSDKKCGGNHCFKNRDKSCILSFDLNGKKCNVECSEKVATNQCKLGNGGIYECSSATDEFNQNPLMIQSLIGLRPNPNFNDGIQTCLTDRGILKQKGDVCGKERCFFGYDFCELWFDKNGCKIGCTTKDGSKNECHQVNGKSEHQCICKGKDCYTERKIIKQLIDVRNSTEFGSSLENCLRTNGVLSDKTCDKMRCFVGFDNSCEVEARMDKTCAVHCSEKSFDSLNQCQVTNNDTAVQCYCKEGKCHKNQTQVNIWQKYLEPKTLKLTRKLEECLYEKDALDKSIKCSGQQCYEGRDTCKVREQNGSCYVECSTENISSSGCVKNGDQYECFCSTDGCLASLSTAYQWKSTIKHNTTQAMAVQGCIDKIVTTTIRPLRTVLPKTIRQGTFEGETLEQLVDRFKSSQQKKGTTTKSGFTFKWWYVLMILALLATIGLFGIVAWSAATRKKRCAAYWKKKEEEEKKKKKDLAAAKKPVTPSKDAEMEVLPETDIIRKGPHHLQKKFKGETTAHLADNQKSESIHDKLEFVPQLNEEVQIGSDVEIIDGMEQTSVEDTVSVSRMDNFNTVRQASSMSTLRY